MSDFARVMEQAAEVTPPPVNTDIPHAYVEGEGAAAPGATLTCTMGNWDGSPGSYDYQWRNDGTYIGGGSGSTYLLREEDDGHTVDCLVTATNVGGSTSIPSDGVPVGTPATQRRKA